MLHYAQSPMIGYDAAMPLLQKPVRVPITKPLDILMVEDNSSDALLTRVSLDGTHIPYRLRTLHKGDDVLPCLAHHQHTGQHHLPDLIMLDLGLPGMNGFDVLESIASSRTQLRNVPIVILTGYEDFGYLQKNHDIWIVDYIKKPCNIKQLKEVLLRIRR